MKGAAKERVYISVIVFFEPNGVLQPKTLIFDDGEKYDITRVLDRCPAAALKAGGNADRFTVRIGGQITYLYYERDPWPKPGFLGRWYIEKQPGT